jgi:acyl-CoA synthetase (AMP-forming)/AMP-acid ligase II/thioesterase domain-containing protein/acyl carrier protein
VIRRWAETRPDARALITEDKYPLTYRALVDVMDRVGASLRALGFGRGDRIAIAHAGRIETGILTVAVCGVATAIPLDPRQTAAEAREKLSLMNAAAVIVGPDISDAIVESARDLGLTIIETEPYRIGGDDGGEAWIGLAVDADETAGPMEGTTTDDVAFIVTTSGTTDRPKIVPTKHKRIIAFAEQRRLLFAMSPEDVGAITRPLHYSAGMTLFIQALYSGGALLVLPDVKPTAFLQIIVDLGTTWFAGGPTMLKAMHRHLMSHPDSALGLCLRHIRQTSGYLEPDIIDDLERLLAAPVLTTYSSSETGAMGLSKPGSGPRRFVPVTGLTDHLGLGESEVRIRGEDGRFLPSGEKGEIVVRGPQVIESYENAPEANTQAFVDGWFRTGDEGYFDENGCLVLCGRIKEIINRGGEKISPAEVDMAILSHPDVKEAATFPLRHPSLGEEVAAAVVQAPGAGLTDQILTRYLLRRLSGFKVPRRFYFVPEIPKTGRGKVQRYALAEQLGVGSDVGAHTAGAGNREATTLEARLQKLWAEALRIPNVGLDDNFFMLGGDSLQAVELFLRIEQELGRRLPRSILFQAGTVAEMARCIEDAAPSSCIVPIQTKGDGPPFFCVHDGNGEVLNYRELARLMGEAQPFYGIQCRGLDREGVPFIRIEEMATYYIQEIKGIQPEGPYYLGGYSFGGRVAYVMAQQLHAAGEEVAFLALLDTASGFGRRRVSWGQWLGHHRDQLRTLPSKELPGYLALRAANLAEIVYMRTRIKCFAMAWRYFEKTNRTVPRFMRRPVPANDMVRRSYRPKTYEGNATLFKAELYAWNHPDAHDGWYKLIRGKLEVRPISGRHYEIVKQPHVQTLARELSDALRKTQASKSKAKRLRIA